MAPPRLELPAVEAVTFDAHGTLFHAPRMGEIYASVLTRHGRPVSATAADTAVHQTWLEFDCAARLGGERFRDHPGGARGFWFRFVDRVCQHLGLEPASRFAKAELYDRFAHREAWTVFPEVPEVLERLGTAGLKLAVVSNWDERLPGLLADLGLAARFEAVVYSQAVGVEKPLAGIFQRAVEALEVPAGRTLHVGDRPREDVEGARAAGLHALLLARAGGGDLADLRPLAVCYGEVSVE